MQPTAEDLIEPVGLLFDRLNKLRISDLPSALIEGLDVGLLLPPNTSAIYFLRSMSQGLLYIGRATNLRGRWRLQRRISDASQIEWELCHAKLREAIALEDVTIYWWPIPPHHLAVAESVLLQIHKPPWNSHRW